MKDFNLQECAKKKIIICSHRGEWGGNIPCNTAAAYDIAIAHGADMIELDVTASADGELFVFHPKKEDRHLNLRNADIRKMPAAEVKKLRYTNLDGRATQEPVYLLDDMLEHLKGKCFINVDKFGDHPLEITKLIKRHEMSDQIVVKSNIEEKNLRVLEEYAPDLQYIGVVTNELDAHRMLMTRNLNYVGLEVVFEEDSNPLVSEAFRQTLRADGKLLWGNSILYDYKCRLAGDHSDDTALKGDPECGWGYFVRNGFDIIQTDWTLALSLYLEKTGQRYRGE